VFVAVASLEIVIELELTIDSITDPTGIPTPCIAAPTVYSFAAVPVFVLTDVIALLPNVVFPVTALAIPNCLATTNVFAPRCLTIE
jgi:hypothetical protein